MKHRKVTASQVARQAGVSPTTVSFVLNDVQAGNISEATRQKVLDAARELNYVPDIAARSLARGRSSNIALVLGKPHQQVFIDEYIPKILTGIRAATQAHGYRIMVEMVDDGANPETYTRLLRGQEVAGMIVSLNSPTPADLEHLADCAAQGYPLVALDTYRDVYAVKVDKLTGVQLVAQHLIKLGHQRIAFITYAPQGNTHSDARLLTFALAMRHAGIEFDASLVRYGAYDPETGYAAMQSLLETDPLPTAVFAMNDVMAFGAMRAIAERGLRIPQDIAVVGFDDMRLAAYATPPLTTIHEPDVEHGRLAGEMLMQLINGEAPPKPQLTLPTRLIVRQSCGGK